MYVPMILIAGMPIKYTRYESRMPNCPYRIYVGIRLIVEGSMLVARRTKNTAFCPRQRSRVNAYAQNRTVTTVTATCVTVTASVFRNGMSTSPVRERSSSAR